MSPLVHPVLNSNSISSLHGAPKQKVYMRNVGLDILRFLAVILVIARHLYLPSNTHFVLKNLAAGGWVGVDLFFVLSGFLVSSILFREYQKHGSVDLKRFFIRRAFKIYPQFWILLAFTLILRELHQLSFSWQQLLGEILFLQNYLGGLWNHTWSLAVEEHFYIGLGILIICLISKNSVNPFRHIPIIFLSIGTTCLSFRVLNLFLHPNYAHDTYLFHTHIRIDSLMFGVLISYLWNFHELENKLSKFPSYIFMATGVLLLSPAFLFELETNKWISVAGVILFYLGAGCLLIAALRYKSTNSLGLRVIAGLGAASYPIYLWHMPVATWGYMLIKKIIGLDTYFLYLLNALIGAFVFGWLLNRLIETPILSIRDRLFPAYSNAISQHEKSRADTTS
jgi:peptidoglycan/LPS O-acetylase OafA/YrhL